MTSLLLLLLACGTPAPPPVPEAGGGAPPVEEAPPAVTFDAEPILAEPVVLGALSRASIDDALQAQAAAVQACRVSGPDAPVRAGKVLVYFVIGADGAVTKARVKSTSLRQEAAEACLVEVVMGTRFAPPQGGGVVVVSYPFVFTAG